MVNQTIISLGEKIHDALRTFADVCDKDWIRPNLSGGCAVGSYLLVEELKSRGITARLVVAETHCWIESEDYIYDITASQYTCPIVRSMSDMDNVEKVRVIPKTNDLTGPYVEAIDVADPVAWLNNTYDGFPQGQRPKGYRIEWNDDSARIYWKGKKRIIG
jgi:hypothetical protein